MLTHRFILSILVFGTTLFTSVQAAELLVAYVGAIDIPSIFFLPINGCNPMVGTNAEGMPVTFDVAVNQSSIELDQFAINLDGDVILPKCATLEPADGPGEGHTVLLTGDFAFKAGGDNSIIPTKVEIIQSASTGKDLMSVDGTILTGLATTNIRLGSRDGPEMALAFWYPKLGAYGRVQVVFEGGITSSDGEEVTDENLAHFFLIDGNGNKTNPIGFGDLGDGDNYLFLDLPPDFNGVPVGVELEAGTLFDPLNYSNPFTTVEVKEGEYEYPLQTDPPQTDSPQTDPPQTDSPQTDSPQTDPPQTDPPQIDPPQTDPPQTASGGERLENNSLLLISTIFSIALASYLFF